MIPRYIALTIIPYHTIIESLRLFAVELHSVFLCVEHTVLTTGSQILDGGEEVDEKEEQERNNMH